LALVVAILGALVAAAGSAALVAAKPARYTAAAEFNVVARSTDIQPLSRSKGLIAEQVARGLKSSRADEYAASGAPADEFTGKWIVGPAFGQISYQITSDDPEVATAAAQAVYDNAGFLGFDLTDIGRPPSVLDLVKVRKAAPTRQPAAKTIAAAAVLGGFAGFALVLLFAVPMRRPQPA
jgi:F0F1-type ATP synthase membrane subunit c/vacuolar-type H+-ATPase subunit K